MAAPMYALYSAPDRIERMRPSRTGLMAEYAVIRTKTFNVSTRAVKPSPGSTRVKTRRNLSTALRCCGAFMGTRRDRNRGRCATSGGDRARGRAQQEDDEHPCDAA